SEPTPRAEESELVWVGEGFPPVPAKVVSRIEKGDYVDLKDLLQQKPSMDESNLSDLEEQGIVVVTAGKHLRSQIKQMRDLATWIEAFMTYVAIRAKKSPELVGIYWPIAVSLLVGQGTIMFRRLAAARGSVTKWSMKDVSLWNETVGRQEVPTPTPSHTQEDKKPLKRKASPPLVSNKKGKAGKNWKGMVCYPFSYSGLCETENCNFLYVCYGRGEGHPQSKCPKKLH
uniref:C3H1-type domain-containing protein n=1 Tax=Amphimedon queenslandica TaxID=400682 RepID=A0A1X7VIM1_AMPQE